MCGDLFNKLPIKSNPYLFLKTVVKIENFIK